MTYGFVLFACHKRDRIGEAVSHSAELVRGELLGRGKGPSSALSGTFSSREKDPCSRNAILATAAFTQGNWQRYLAFMNAEMSGAGDLLSMITKSSSASTPCRTPAGCRQVSPGSITISLPAIVPLSLPLTR